MTAHRRDDVRILVPADTDSVVRSATTVIGGPLGQHAIVGARGRQGIAATIVLMGAAMLSLGVLQKGHCLANGWSEPDHFWRACYSDVTIVNLSSALVNRGLPYAGPTPSDTPLLSGLVMWVLALVSPAAGGDVMAQRWIFGLWALAAVVLTGAAIVALIGMHPDRPWQAAHLAVSPVIAVLALMSVDLVGVVLVIWAIWAWQRRWPVAAGILLGLAFLVRPYPLIFLLAIVLVAWRGGHTRSAIVLTLSAVASAAGMFLPFLFVLGDAVLLAPRGFATDAVGFGTVALIPSLLGYEVATQAATVFALAGWALAVFIGYWWVGRVDHLDAISAIITLSAPMLVVVMLSSKTLSVQTGIWVLPFLALSAVPWRDHLIWAAVEIVHFEATWLYIGFGSDPGRGLPGSAYALVVLLRAATWAWVLIQVWRWGTTTMPQQYRTVAIPLRR